MSLSDRWPCQSYPSSIESPRRKHVHWIGLRLGAAHLLAPPTCLRDWELMPSRLRSKTRRSSPAKYRSYCQSKRHRDHTVHHYCLYYYYHQWRIYGEGGGKSPGVLLQSQKQIAVNTCI